MKKSVKIIILVCVIALAIAIIILSSVVPKKVNNKNNQNNGANNTTNGNGNVVSDDENIKISYEATSEVFKIAGTDKTITVYQDFPTVEAKNEDVKNKLQANLGKIANEEFADYKKQVQDRTVC